jgi:hypothetical protein
MPLPAIIIEKFDSREATVGIDSPSVDLQFMVLGTELDAEVRALVQATLPLTYGNLVFQNYHIAHQGGGVWEVTARYGKLEPKEAGQSSYSFDTGGGNQKITQSLETVASYGDDPPDFQGAIGVSTDSVEGTDITIPVFNFTETHYIPIALVTGAYKTTLFYLTGRVNHAPFKGFARGEVLFLGASGSQRGTEDWEIAFKFAASPNATDLKVGGITGIEKKGWEYLWVRYADAEDEETLIKQPVAAYVERVYEYGNFALLGIGV